MWSLTENETKPKAKEKTLLNLFDILKIRDFSGKRRNALDHTYLDIVKHLIWCNADIYVYLMGVKERLEENFQWFPLQKVFI